MIDNPNQKIYSAPNIVGYYAQLSQLQPAEQTIINLLQHQLSTMTMLDIGVGGGRTTKHFFPIVGQYIGIDYCPQMITACKKRFSAFSESISLEVGDARKLSQFNDNFFDFILFSFNGIDYISHGDRLKVFQEINRVGKSGGYFFFSTHNLQGIEKEFNWQKNLSFNPITTYVNLVMFALFRWFNPSLTSEKLTNSPYLIIRDESHNFRLQTYYIRPLEQIKQLQEYFSEIKIYSWKNGLDITDEIELLSQSDMWIYYLCMIR
ncbi:class I SAM-dependent methyltransferase [Aphanothece sacrum]|uniref:Methylase n=1 Tax=Aphanothece sacrum FPU1 TaxID=1920663 RepID=A0A401IBV7_APHSA|nr:class I SAM-dependent methyltransferase [Aphanothece sacrum]GBF78757.1 methylase [Aphanothece sacrum FPU1]GBF82989.1 methylase [Aphanothece sacrum FPU3]